MSYVPFARKYRPRFFREVVGQEVAVKIIKNSVKANRIAHAYLFAGPRGVGKTTLARLLAKSVNCLNPAEGEPCGECENCREIDKGSFPDLVEIDAASNRGIDDVRALREAVNYRPLKGKYKVYIIDEAHMLTKEAFNALLKTLEEPPENTIFVLCTTEYDKILPTILSRCQRIVFKRAGKKEVLEYLKGICQKEGIDYSEDALSLLAELSDGSMRDSASLLDQATAYTEANITLESVKELLGILTKEELLRFIKTLLESKVREALEFIEELYYRGFNLEKIWGMLHREVNNLILFKSLENPETVLEEVELYEDFKEVPLESLLYLEEVISRGGVDARTRDALSAYRLAVIKSYLIKDILPLSRLIEGGLSLSSAGKEEETDPFLKEALSRATRTKEGGKTVFLFSEQDWRAIQDRLGELRALHPDADFRPLKKKREDESTTRLF